MGTAKARDETRPPMAARVDCVCGSALRAAAWFADFCSVSEQETSVSATAQPIYGFKIIKLARSSSYALFLPAKGAICKLTYPHLHANRLFSLWRLQRALHDPEQAPTIALDDFS